MRQGKYSQKFENSVYITSAASVAGKKEGEGPLGTLFDYVEEDSQFGQDNWEAAESQMQKTGWQRWRFKRRGFPRDRCSIFWEETFWVRTLPRLLA